MDRLLELLELLGLLNSWIESAVEGTKMSQNAQIPPAKSME
jgi:hypothetical protein